MIFYFSATANRDPGLIQRSSGPHAPNVMLQGSFFHKEGTGKPGKRARRREVVVRQG